MGTHENDCFGNFTLCPHGATLSVWFKFGPQTGKFTTLLSSANVKLQLTKKTDEIFKFGGLILNGTHQHRFPRLPKIAATFDWIHFGMTYSKVSGFKVGFIEINTN